MPSEPNVLFVYGTLRKNCRHPMHSHLSRDARPMGPGHCMGVLFNLGPYPGAVPSDRSEDRITGELYKILKPASLFPPLDAYEGFKFERPTESLFIRLPTRVQRADETECRAWIYWYNRSTEGAIRIYSGDYLNP